MLRLDYDSLRWDSCISPYFVRDEEFTSDSDCMCMMLYDENMHPLSVDKTAEFAEALNKAILDYCWKTPFKADGNSLYGRWFVPTPIGEDTLEYSVMFILYMASLKVEHYGYSGIAVLAMEGRKDEHHYAVWHCLCFEKGDSTYSETWLKSQQNKDNTFTFTNNEGEQVGVNEIAELLEQEFDFDPPSPMDDMLKKVLEKITFE